MKDPTRVLLADDHSVLRAGLAALLEPEPDIEVIGEAADGYECSKKARVLNPDIILMDVNMPHCGGLEALSTIRRDLPDIKILILTMHDDIGYLKRVLASGGSGYVLKQAASDDLLTALRTVRDGGVFVHPHHAQALAADTSGRPDSDVEDTCSELRSRFESLSDREAEVFRLLSLGHSNGEIAELVFLSVKTVETYKARLMRKLGTTNRAELVRVALELELLR